VGEFCAVAIASDQTFIIHR